MCYGQQRDLTPPRTRQQQQLLEAPNAAAVENLRGRLAETEARLERARAREAELSRQLEEMKRFVLVMEIIENYLRRRFREQQQEYVARLVATSAGGARK